MIHDYRFEPAVATWDRRFLGVNMNIADPDEPFPRGKYMGTSSRPLIEAERFKRCAACGGYVDILDLSWVEDHEGPLPHPAQDRAQ
jgi:hypothetical protein